MISKKDIKKLAGKILKSQKGIRDHQIIHPKREWMIALLVGFCLMVSGAMWSAFTYDEISGLEVQNEDSTEIKPAVYRNELVLSALADFRERGEEYSELLRAAETIVLPEEDEVVAVPSDQELVDDQSEADEVEENNSEELDTSTPSDETIEIDIN